MLQVEIQVKGCINARWSEWLDRLTVTHTGHDETVLAGAIADQAALYGLLSKLRDLGLSLSSLRCTEVEDGGRERQ